MSFELTSTRFSYIFFSTFHPFTDNVTAWDGVRNHQAAGNLKNMKNGDLAFFYHSGKERRIMGIVRVIRESYLDKTDPKGKFVCVDVETVEPLENPVTLAQIKAKPEFKDLALVRQSRLSVMSVEPEAWDLILELSKSDK